MISSLVLSDFTPYTSSFTCFTETIAASIIMKELLSDYSNSNPFNILVNSSYIASALEIHPNYLNPSDIYFYSVENPSITDQQLGVQTVTSWYISNAFIEYINSLQINSTNNNEIWLDFWKTYTLPQITNQLLNSNQFEALNITNVCDYIFIYLLRLCV